MKWASGSNTDQDTEDWGLPKSFEEQGYMRNVDEWFDFKYWTLTPIDDYIFNQINFFQNEGEKNLQYVFGSMFRVPKLWGNKDIFTFRNASSKLSLKLSDMMQEYQ